MNDLLNPYQKASLTTVLRIFEENLRQAGSWLDGMQAEGILYRQEMHLTYAQRNLVCTRIATALAEIAVLSDKLGLEPEAEDPVKLICGQMSAAWVNLMDSQADKLKRFGDVHPDAAREIDPHIQRLAKAALELVVLCENYLSTPASSDAENLIGQ